VALLFSIGLILRVSLLTEERLLRSEQWRALHAEERPAGDHGRRWARAALENVLLRFAKSAAGIAAILYGSALVLTVT
jgi:hypothetical protein